jgi:hypothetical protein
VALLTSRRAGSGDLQAVLAGDVPPRQLITALEIVATGLLEVLFPADRGELALQILGLRALGHGGQQS